MAGRGEARIYPSLSPNRRWGDVSCLSTLFGAQTLGLNLTDGAADILDDCIRAVGTCYESHSHSAHTQELDVRSHTHTHAQSVSRHSVRDCVPTQTVNTMPAQIIWLSDLAVLQSDPTPLGKLLGTFFHLCWDSKATLSKAKWGQKRNRRMMHTLRVPHNKSVKRLSFLRGEGQEGGGLISRYNFLLFNILQTFVCREYRVGVWSRQSGVVRCGVWWILRPCVCEVIITLGMQRYAMHISSVNSVDSEVGFIAVTRWRFKWRHSDDETRRCTSLQRRRETLSELLPLLSLLKPAGKQLAWVSTPASGQQHYRFPF